MGISGKGLKMKVCVQGLWHLGSVTAACIASVGHDVVGLDFDHGTIEGLKNGKAPLFEPALDDLIGKSINAGNLRFSMHSKEAVSNAEVLWVAYDTPVDDDDVADVDYVIAQIESVIPYLARGTTVLISSQMPVGSIRRLESIAAKNFSELDLGFAYSPENLRLGKALDVFLKPDRIVVGTRTERDKARLQRLLTSITNRIEWMSVESAEMSKHAINAFLATSVTFANEISAICELTGADAKEVERGLKSEQRIGPKAYLSAGGAFAGGTLARDVNFLNQVSSVKGLTTPLLFSIKPSNDEHKKWVRRRLSARFTALAGRAIAIWGLTYKPGTNILRRSLAVELCNWLLDQGACLRVHDPAVAELPSEWGGRVSRCNSPMQAVQRAEALVVATEWPLYRDEALGDLPKIAPGLLVLDANRFLDSLAHMSGIDYVAVGIPQEVILV